jgi:cysteinyl-tRNA synthetase
MKDAAHAGPQKMSKSLGNEIVVHKLFEGGVEPETLRFFLLATHYRRPIDYSEERLEEIRRGLDGFYRFFERYERITKKGYYNLPSSPERVAGGESELLPSPPGRGAGGEGEFAELRKKFLEHMDDDFNTGGAVGVLYELLSALNRFADAKQLEAGTASADDVKIFGQGVLYLKELSQLLGVFTTPNVTAKADDGLTAGLMQLLIDLRAEARKAKNFALGDQIRKRLTELKVTLEDRPGGTIWRKE